MAIMRPAAEDTILVRVSGSQKTYCAYGDSVPGGDGVWAKTYPTTDLKPLNPPGDAVEGTYDSGTGDWEFRTSQEIPIDDCADEDPYPYWSVRVWVRYPGPLPTYRFFDANFYAECGDDVDYCAQVMAAPSMEAAVETAPVAAEVETAAPAAEPATPEPVSPPPAPAAPTPARKPRKAPAKKKPAKKPAPKKKSAPKKKPAKKKPAKKSAPKRKAAKKPAKRTGRARRRR